MANSRPLEYNQDQFGKTQAYQLQFLFQITAAKTVKNLAPAGAVLSFFDALTQAQIDAQLDSTNEFLADKFDATSMGTDAFGVLVNTSNQVAKLLRASCALYSGTNLGTLASNQTLTALAASTLAAQASVSPFVTSGGKTVSGGNLGAKFVLTGLDALTAGLLVVSFDFLPR